MKTENKHTPTPWFAIEASTGWTIADDYGREIAREMNNGIDMGESDSKHIVHCVNSHESLKAEIEQLKEKLRIAENRIDFLTTQNPF